MNSKIPLCETNERRIQRTYKGGSISGRVHEKHNNLRKGTAGGQLDHDSSLYTFFVPFALCAMLLYYPNSHHAKLK